MSSLPIGNSSVPIFTKSELDSAPKASWLTPDECRAQLKSQLAAQGYTVSDAYLDYAINEPLRSNSINNVGGSLLSPSEWDEKNAPNKSTSGQGLTTQSKPAADLSSMLLESLSTKFLLDIKQSKSIGTVSSSSMENNSFISIYLNNSGD